MKVWNQAPLVRLIIPFLIGIVTAVYFPIQFNYILHVLSFLFVLIAAVVLIPKLNISYRRSYLFGLLVNTTLLIFGYQLTIYKTEKFSSNHFSNYINRPQLYHTRLEDSYIEKENSLKAILDILEVKKSNSWI